MAARGGFALVLSLLMVLALMVLAMGVLAVGTREQVIAATVVRKGRADRQAEAAALDAVRAWSTRRVDGLAIGEETSPPTPSSGTAVSVTRADSGLLLIRGVGRVPGPDGDVASTAALLVRTLPSVATATPAAVTATGPVTVHGATVSGATGCGGEGTGVMAPSIAVAGGEVSGVPPVLEAVPPDRPTPDALAPPTARRIADLHVTTSVVTPRVAAIAGECLADGRNWGSPDPASPCHGLLPVVFAASDLTVVGGVGRMVLVVDGDLTVADGAVLEGLVVARGQLELREGSTVRGGVRTGSADLIDGWVTRDACILAAVAAAPALDRAYRPPVRWWIPAF